LFIAVKALAPVMTNMGKFARMEALFVIEERRDVAIQEHMRSRIASLQVRKDGTEERRPEKN
jgi:hypothetical protein